MVPVVSRCVLCSTEHMDGKHTQTGPRRPETFVSTKWVTRTGTPQTPPALTKRTNTTGVKPFCTPTLYEDTQSEKRNCTYST